MKKKELSELIINYFRNKPTEAISLKQLFLGLKLTTHPTKMLCTDIVKDMAEDNFLIETEKGKWKLNDRGQIMTGTFIRKSNGKNSFIPDDGGEPIFIAERNSAHAMNNDKVKISLCAKCKKQKIEGQVIEILERAQATFVGTLKVSKNYAFLITETSTLANDIFIPKEKLKGAKNGDKAVVKITEWPDEAKNPFGEVVDVLGKAGDNNTEMHAILAEYGLPYTYPQSVEDAAEKLSAEITKEDYEEREDFRDVTTFTIDPKDAKDFDDALSIRQLKPGLWEVGVHIADVSHYVKEGSIIDKEALKRATSVYLVDRTIPMLPERLCNFICSLRPNEEKLAYSVIFDMNEKAEVKDYRIRHTVIKSDRRFTYEEAQNIIETGEGDYKEEVLELIRGRSISDYCITGGEPTLAGKAFFDILRRSAREHPEALISVLTNGRLFSDRAFVRRLAGIPAENVLFCVSLHSELDAVHDAMTGVRGSCAQTQQGIYNLAGYGFFVEIRTVISQYNCRYLAEFAEHLGNYFPFCAHVAFMGLELHGHAETNRDRVEVSPEAYAPCVKDAVLTLVRRGIPVSLYNIPLCLCPAEVRGYARRSISDWKNIYLPRCRSCALREECCGFFSTSSALPETFIKPFTSGGHV